MEHKVSALSDIIKSAVCQFQQKSIKNSQSECGKRKSSWNSREEDCVKKTLKISNFPCDHAAERDRECHADLNKFQLKICNRSNCFTWCFSYSNHEGALFKKKTIKFIAWRDSLGIYWKSVRQTLSVIHFQVDRMQIEL